MHLVNTTLALLLMSSALLADPPAGKPRVFVTESQSWEVAGGVGGTDTIGGSVHGGARPQTAEIIKTFSERCPNVVITNNREKANYVVVLDHEGGKNIVLRDNKFAVFNQDGDAIKSGSTRSLGNAVKNACQALTSDWDAQGAKSKQSQAAVGEQKN